LAEFSAALDLPEVQLYSLQVDRSEADAARLAELGIIDLAPQIHDFADTAAWLDRLDLLITVDTAICHLAGAMGKPVWTLLYFAADWRWLLDREDTPWYPTMRLFRQTTAGDWSGPLARVRSALSELARLPGHLSTDSAIEPLQNYFLLGQHWIAEQGLDSWLAWLHQNPPRTLGGLSPAEQAVIAFWQGMSCDRPDYQDWAAAQDHLRRAIALDPSLGNAAARLSYILANQGQFTEALAVTEQALSYLPEDGGLRMNRALCLLTLGRWREAWPDYEWRGRSGQGALTDVAGPQWDGRPLPGQTLLVLAEQGYGDTLQFGRYLAWAKQRCDRVVMWCGQPPLRRLLPLLPGLDQVYEGDNVAIQYHAHVHLLSLPGLADTTVDNVPAPIPYLRSLAPAPPLPDRQPDRLAVGIVWSSGYRSASLLAAVHRQKSADLTELAIALNLPQVQLYSLQVDRSEADAARLAELGIIDLAPQIHDFADTAAWLDQLDLLITVDTAICHLAGAMGKPVWTLLYFAADWRWLLDREDTPWYPTMRLFRQTTAGDWSGPLARVRSALGELARSPQALHQTLPQTLPQRSR
jgi:ADP-heptose:LPS heptosyltransferase